MLQWESNLLHHCQSLHCSTDVLVLCARVSKIKHMIWHRGGEIKHRRLTFRTNKFNSCWVKCGVFLALGLHHVVPQPDTERSVREVAGMEAVDAAEVHAKKLTKIWYQNTAGEALCAA